MPKSQCAECGAIFSSGDRLCLRCRRGVRPASDSRPAAKPAAPAEPAPDPPNPVSMRDCERCLGAGKHVSGFAILHVILLLSPAVFLWRQASAGNIPWWGWWLGIPVAALIVIGTVANAIELHECKACAGSGQVE